MKRLLILALILAPVFCNAQTYLDTITGPPVYIYPGYAAAKCRLVVKDCENCPQRVMRVWRKNDNEFYRTVILTTPITFKNRVVFRSGGFWKLFKMELYYINWYDLDW